MLYIKRKIKKCKFKEISELKGLDVKPKTSKGTIKITNILICDKDLRNGYAKKQLDKKFSKMYKKIYDFLISDDDSEEGIKACLGEIEKTKQEIFNKYKEHLKLKQYREYLAKIVLTENEFKNKYKEREYFANLIKNAYNRMNYDLDEEINRGKGR